MKQILYDNNENISEEIEELVVKIKKIPIFSFKTRLDNLRILTCSFINLKYLPDILPNSLEEIYAGNNIIEDLPKIFPKNLRILHLNDNKIKIVYSFPENLIFVNLSRNLLEELPKFPRLIEYVIISSNKIKQIQEIVPETLKSFTINGNPIKKCPERLSNGAKLRLVGCYPKKLGGYYL
ncbi:MAG TPA: hypothetical protein V6C58_17425 [Allocoleopsis sp.]